MKVLVTGANGFIGSHLVPLLAGAGFDVAAGIGPGGYELPPGVPCFPVDICSGEGLPSALAGADAVVHLAARNHVLRETAGDPLAEYRRVNVEGARNAARAAALAGAGLFVHVSSVKAVGEESECVLDESAPCSPGTPYGISKLESEEAVQAESAASGMRTVILRLPIVYGPRNLGNVPRMIRWADRGLPFPLTRPENLRSMVYVENVAEGIGAVLGKMPEVPTVYFLKDREDYSTRRVYSAVCRELGKTPRFLPIPAMAVRLAAGISEDFRKITGSFRVSSAKIEAEIGFFPPVSLEEGIARTVDWHKRSAR